MASRTKQIQTTRANQQRAERYLDAQIREWHRDVLATWTPGANVVRPDEAAEIAVVLRRAYNRIFRDVLGADPREFKSDDPYIDVMRDIGETLEVESARRVTVIVPRVISTTEEQMRRAEQTAIAEEAAGAEARRIARSSLALRMRNHRLVIAVTEANWGVATTRHTAILAIDDLMSGTLERLVTLLEQGRVAEARRLSREINRMIRLPTSIAQGDIIRFVNDNRDRLMTPIIQARVIERLRDFAQRNEVTEKVWQTMGDGKVRNSHANANGQKRASDEPFTLENGMLQYPMDASLGASLGEIINCRCVAVYE
jgi:hypothetical protein